jgi:transposase-like protein
MISPMAGTIMEKSSTPLRLWFYGMYLMASTRCGISAKQLERELGVTYKTAWRIFKQIRSMLGENIILEGSSVEIDATWVGGKAKNMHKAKREKLGGRGTAGKVAVFGLVERQGDVVTVVVGEESQATVLPQVRARIQPTSVVYSDEHAAYNPIQSMGYQHRRVNHAAKVYVVGDAHTNTIEGFWSLAKRGISGVNHSVSTKYLQTYLNEYAFRYNRRDQEQPMFEAFLGQVVRTSRGE